MLSFLKDHPFAVEAFFETSLVLTYAVPKEQLQNLIPECLELDTFEDSWGFVAVAMVKTKNLRPKGFPEFMGNDFILTGYRIFVRYTTSQGKRWRGLYILKSETDKKKMEIMGNIFTHYNYTTTDVEFVKEESIIKVRSIKSSLDIKVDTGKETIPLPSHSPFKDWKEARRYAGPLPFTFTYNKNSKEVLIIEGVREDWTPMPVEVLENEVGFLKDRGFKDIVLANAFIIHDIPYYWKKGKKELWKG
jgi:uncharacterized protein YqjF (DUF2071 family)